MPQRIDDGVAFHHLTAMPTPARPKFDGDLVLATPIQLRGEIDEESADFLVDRLREIGGPVVLEIASGGGCARSARRICRAIARRMAEVHATVTDYAASGAALVWLACATRSLPHDATVRFHFSRYVDLAVANADEPTLRAMADSLAEIDAWILGLFTSQTGIAPEQANELLMSDRPVGRAEAFRLGLCS